MQIPKRRHFFALYGALRISIFVLHVQAQTGNFVNIDCGTPANSTYADANTDLMYESDASYIDSGVSKALPSPTFGSDSVDRQFWYVRSFPEGTRNCYTLSSPVGKNTTFLIRARFLHGNYDGKNQLPEFDLYLGISPWDTVKVQDASKVLDKEIIHVINSDKLYLCLVDKKSGTTFISAIELRKLSSNAYPTNPPTSLMTYFRYDLGSSATQTVRYADDSYDRFWKTYDNTPSWTTISTKLPVDSNQQNKNNHYSPGSTVMETAVVPTDHSQPLNIISWTPDDPETNFYFYLHFAEIQQLQANQSRIFDINLNKEIYYEEVTLSYLSTDTIYSTGPRSEKSFDFALVKTTDSTLPPLINAIEVYTTRDIIESQTLQGDVDALLNIKSTYGVKKIWQGDPCAPGEFVWDGIQCSNNMDENSSIKSQTLSSSGLTGNLSPYISNLSFIQILDLSHNNLTGQVPDFLTMLENLEVINLMDNNLTGVIPQQLLQKNKSSSIILSLEGNPNICLSSSCDGNNGNNNSKKVIITLVLAIGAPLMLVTVTTIIYLCLKKKAQGFTSFEKIERTFGTVKDKAFTFPELLQITNNFEVTIGEGGFGKVYLGTLEDGGKVAIKTLSQTSKQGCKEFQTVARLLVTVHHKNLASLVGYCDDPEHLALIYEYMSNGDLRQRLSDRNMGVLTWRQRVEIAIDVAEGLEYLHKGHDPPIVHRDLKTSNILLNERMQAKIADFGLSREFANEFESYILTRPAGTLGYLDPEFHSSGNLSKKSDVYSFGIILLELISSYPAIKRSPEGIVHIVQWVTPLVENGNIESIVDPRLQGIFNQSMAQKMIEVAMACVATTAIQRPNISRVLSDLSDCLAILKSVPPFETTCPELEITQLAR